MFDDATFMGVITENKVNRVEYKKNKISKILLDVVSFS